jgi:hypothetical protein
VSPREYTLNPDGTLRPLSPSRVRTVPCQGGSALIVARGDVDLDAITATVARALAPAGGAVPGEFCKAPAPEPLPFDAAEGRSIRELLLEAMETLRTLPPPKPEPIMLPKALFDVYARAFADATGTDWERHVVGMRALAAHAVSDSAHDDARTTPPVRAHTTGDRAHDDAHLRAQATPSMPVPERAPRVDQLALGVPVRDGDPMAMLVVHDPHPDGPPALVDRPSTDRAGVRFVGGPLHGRTGHAHMREWEDGERRPLPRFHVPTIPEHFFVGLEVYVRTRLLACGAWAYEWRPIGRSTSRQVLHRRDLPDAHVIEHAWRRWNHRSGLGVIHALEVEGVPHNLAYAKVMHLTDRGLLEYGGSPYGAWPTTAGLAHIGKRPERDA